MFDIIYNNREDFIKENSVIHLKPYRDGLQFYTSFDSNFTPIYSNSGETVVITGTPTIQTTGVFSNCGELSGSVVYNKNNFITLNEKGTIQFRLKSAFNNAYSYQEFNMNLNTVVPATDPETIVPGDYSIKVIFGGLDQGHFTITLVATDGLLEIATKLMNAVNTATIMANYVNDVLRIEGKEKGIYVSVEEPTNGDFSLITLLGGVDTAKLLNAPLVNTTFFSLKNDTDNSNLINLIHNINGTIQLEMYNATTKIVDTSFEWNNEPTLWYDFAISYDESNVKLYLNGTIAGIANTGFTRVYANNKLTLFGTADNHHFIDELIISNLKLFDSSTYTVETNPMTKYSVLNPYIDIEYGKGFKNNEVKDVELSCSTNCKFVVKLGSSWYYYYSGSWVLSDGTFAKSITDSILATQFKELYFDEDNYITIRVYFNSNGVEDCWLENLDIIFNPLESERATIVGNIIIPSTLDLTNNKNLLIVTDLGTKEVDLTSYAINPASVSKEEIVSSINSSSVPGLENAIINPEGYLVLTAETVGSASYISVQEPQTSSAVSLVWGTLQSDYGLDNTGRVFDYEEIFRYTRSSLGAPQVPVELTDEQLNDALSAAVFEYNRWRNVNENIMTLDLVGDGTTGYEIPAAVGGINNIIDIIVQPRTGLVFGNIGDDLMASIYTQFFFRNGNSFIETAADYYLTLSAQRDIDNIMGTAIKHYFYNNKLWIFPIPTRTMTVGIKYRSTLLPEEIVYNQQIRDLTLAKAKIILGTIRSTFGGRIPMGDSEITLNGDGLKSEGREEWTATVQFLQKTQPIEFIIG